MLLHQEINGTLDSEIQMWLNPNVSNNKVANAYNNITYIHQK